MNKEFVPYEQSLELKELGFDEPCMRYYYQDKQLSDLLGREVLNSKCADVHITSPLYSQAFRWFREKHKINSGIIPYYDYFYFLLKSFNNDEEYCSNTHIELSYEEAELACLKKLIEIVKSQKS